MVDWRDVRQRRVRDRLETVFQTFENSFGITKLLDTQGEFWFGMWVIVENQNFKFLLLNHFEYEIALKLYKSTSRAIATSDPEKHIILMQFKFFLRHPHKNIKFQSYSI